LTPVRRYRGGLPSLDPGGRGGDFLDVNPSSFRRLLAVVAICGGVAGCTFSTSNVVPAGGNLYTVTREAKTTFNRNIDTLKEQARGDAAKFCAERGRQLQVVDVTAARPFLTTGFISAKVTFRAVDPNEAAAPAAEPAPGPAAVGAPGAAEVPPSGDLYSQLIKLDDLRKRGILTEEEFQAEKRKVLARSK
jgi:hypothetical protein